MQNSKLAPFVGLLRQKFQVRIAAKTGWGKNELLSEYDQAVAETLSALVDKADEVSDG